MVVRTASLPTLVTALDFVFYKNPEFFCCKTIITYRCFARAVCARCR